MTPKSTTGKKYLDVIEYTLSQCTWHFLSPQIAFMKIELIIWAICNKIPPNFSVKRFSLLAWTIHLLNGALLGEIYAAILKRFLPGPNWLKRAIFGELFIVSAWWLTLFADKYLPVIKSGELPKLATWASFFQNTVRHFVFGITLGLLYRD